MSVTNKIIANNKLLPFFLLPLAVLLLHATYYYPFLTDDALISLRYADRFLQGKGLTWSDAFPVEGYSNLAWVLLASIFGKLGLDLIVALRVMGITCFAGVLYLNYRIWSNKQLPAISLFVSQLLFVLCAPVAIWSIGGLEQPLIALCIVVAVYGVYEYLLVTAQKFLWLASLGLAVLCITRPDSPLLCVGLALGVFWCKNFSIRKSFLPIMILAALPLIFVVGQLWFRQHYYNAWLPNTAYIKLTPSGLNFLKGFQYVLLSFVFLLPWPYLFIKQLVKDKTFVQQPLSKLVLPIVLLWLFYVVFIGGDIFAGLRHFVVVIALLLLLSPILLNWLIYVVNYSRKIQVALIFFFLLTQFFSYSSIAAKFERWEWHGEVLAKVLKAAFDDRQPLLAVSAAGTLPYFTGFPAIDMLGLNDHYIARNPERDPTLSPIGHGHGNARYVLERHPDIVSFCLPDSSLGKKPCHFAEKSLFAQSPFQADFVLVRVKGYNPYPYIGNFWFNKKSSKIGIQKNNKAVLVPGYLFSTNPDSYTQLDENDNLVMVLEPGMRATISGLEVPDQLSSVEINSSGLLAYTVVKDEESHMQTIVLENQSEETALLKSLLLSW